jgi:hypothetical protein
MSAFECVHHLIECRECLEITVAMCEYASKFDKYTRHRYLPQADAHADA